MSSICNSVPSSCGARAGLSGVGLSGVWLAGLLLLGACSQAPAQDMTAGQRTEAAIVRMKAEQARTDRAEARKRAEKAALYEQSLKLPEGQRGITPPPSVGR